MNEYDYEHLNDFNYHMHTNELTDWFEDESGETDSDETDSDETEEM